MKLQEKLSLSARLPFPLRSLFPLSFLVSRPMEDPIRSELFSEQRFDQHARSLAAAQTITDDPASGFPLTPRLRENEKILQETFRYLTGEVQQKKTIHPAAEWLLDSFYVVEEQLCDIKRFLPHDFYNELPKLSEGFLKGYPRVYGLAWAYVAHIYSRFDPDSLGVFRRAPTSGWSPSPSANSGPWPSPCGPRHGGQPAPHRRSYLAAFSRRPAGRRTLFVDQLLGLIEDSPLPSAPRLLETAFAFRPSGLFWSSSSSACATRTPGASAAVRWLNEKLAAEKNNRRGPGHLPSVNRQAANNSTVRNIITSFRDMVTFDWQEYFESVSLAEEILNLHPDYPRMDFKTRNSYRTAVEELSRGLEIKRNWKSLGFAVERAKEGADHHGGFPPAWADPGYSLIAEGRRAFEKKIGFRVPVKKRFLRFCTDHPALTYLGNIFFMTAVILWIAGLF